MNSLAKEALKLPSGFASPHTARAAGPHCSALPRAAQSAPGHGARSNFHEQNHKKVWVPPEPHMDHTSPSWNINLIFQLINMIYKNELPEPDCRRVQAAEKGGTDPAVLEEMNQETDPTYRPQPHQV